MGLAFMRRGDVGSTPPRGRSGGGFGGDGFRVGHEMEEEDTPDMSGPHVSDRERKEGDAWHGCLRSSGAGPVAEVGR